jgi:beta-lactamase class A
MTQPNTLSAAITEAEAKGAKLGLGIITPSGARIAHNGKQKFPAASTVKIAIMIELFRRADAKTVDLAARHVLAEAEKSPGSGVLAQMAAGAVLTLHDLAYLMMSISDNTATNILIDTVGMAQVNAAMRSLGMADSVLGRPMRGRLAQAGEQENIAVPAEYAEMMHAILTQKAASPAACAAMVALLEKQQNDRRIARHLPRENRPRWGSKTGSNVGVVNDVGFIETPNGPLVIAAFVTGADPLAGEAIIGDLARAALADCTK